MRCKTCSVASSRFHTVHSSLLVVGVEGLLENWIWSGFGFQRHTSVMFVLDAKSSATVV